MFFGRFPSSTGIETAVLTLSNSFSFVNSVSFLFRGWACFFKIDVSFFHGLFAANLDTNWSSLGLLFWQSSFPDDPGILLCTHYGPRRARDVIEGRVPDYLIVPLSSA